MGLPRLFHVFFFDRFLAENFPWLFHPKKCHDPRDDTRSHFGTPPDSPKRSAHSCSPWRMGRNPNHQLILFGKKLGKIPQNFVWVSTCSKTILLVVQDSIWDKLWVIHPRVLKLWTQFFVAFMGTIWRKTGYSCPTELGMMGEKNENHIDSNAREKNKNFSTNPMTDG